MRRRARLVVALTALAILAAALLRDARDAALRDAAGGRGGRAAGTRRHIAEPPRVPPGAGTVELATAPGAAPRAARVGTGRVRLLTALPARDGDPAQIARDLLAEYGSALGLDALPGRLALRREFDSVLGHHVRFVQTLGGVRVLGSEVSAHVGADGRPLLVRADVHPLRGLADDPAAVVPQLGPDAARAAAAAFVRDDDEDDDADTLRADVREPELVIVPDGRDAALAWSVVVRTDDESLRVLVDARDGSVLRADDGRVGVDGRGTVFQPNPVHSRGDGSLRDQNDQESPAVAAARVDVTLARLDGTGFLRGQWADLTRSPVSTFQANLDWSYLTRTHQAFEQVMCYYHIDRVQDRLQTLGITNVNANAQHVNAHARTDDQSNYDIFDDILEFGDGGVDDAEDGDVVVHEYGHALQFDQVEDFGATGEGGAMGEGFADFLAVVMHESGRPTWDVLFASWDATALTSRSPPYLRRVDRDKRYPDDYVREVHDDGEIWSRFLYDLRLLIGADDALRVVVASHFLLGPNARFREGVDALLVANVQLREGRDDASIRALLDARGLPYTLPDAPLPPEEASEDNDTLETAAPLTVGTYARYLLADDDWFRIDVPPFRRVVVSAAFDPEGTDLDLDLVDAEGRRIHVSHGTGGVEEVEGAAGPEGAVVYARCSLAESAPPGAYDLTVADLDLEVLGPRQTLVRRLQPGTRAVFRVAVDPGKVDEGAALLLRSSRVGKKARTDLRLFDPDAREVVGFDGARKGGGGRATAVVDRSGDWIGELVPREGAAGRYKLRVRLR